MKPTNATSSKLCVFSILIMTLCCSSCRTYETSISDNRVQSDTLYKSLVRHDSIYIYNDRETYKKGDTVFRTQTITKYRLRNVIDTVHHVVHDTTYISRNEVYNSNAKHSRLYDLILSVSFSIMISLFILLLCKK